MWCTLASLEDTNVLEEEETGLAGFLVSFMVLDLWQNFKKHGKDNVFVLISAVERYLPNALFLFKNFYKDMNEAMTGESKRGRKSLASDNHPGRAYRDLSAQ